MKINYYIIILAMICVSACKKHTPVTPPPQTEPQPEEPQNIAGDSTVHSATSIVYPDSSISYYGHVTSEGDCSFPMHMNDDQKIIVNTNVHDNWIYFPGFGGLAASQGFSINAQNVYWHAEGKATYKYRIIGDSLFMDYARTGGQCYDMASFRGKRQ